MMPIRDMDHGLDMPDIVLDVATAVWMDFKFGSVGLPSPTPCNITFSFFIPSGESDLFPINTAEPFGIQDRHYIAVQVGILVCSSVLCQLCHLRRF